MTQEQMKLPWDWKDEKTVVLDLVDGKKEFKLIPAAAGKVQSFRQALSLANKVSSTFDKALKAFETGAAEYTNGARRLKKLLFEYGKAANEQYATACGVGAFFEPAGILQEFPKEQVDLLTELAFDAIERLLAKPTEKPKEVPPAAA